MNLNAFTSDNVPVSVAGSLFFKVEDPEKALFSVSNYEDAVSNIGESSARAVIGKFTYDKIISQRTDINTEMVKTIDKSLDIWGILCNRFEITDFAPQNEKVARHLEKQMEAERSRRENELNTQAKIRTSEGERDAIKLQSDAKYILLLIIFLIQLILALINIICIRYSFIVLLNFFSLQKI